MSARQLLRRRRSTAVAVFAGFFLISACGVPTGGDTRTIEPSSVPYGLLRDRQPSASGQTGSTTGRGQTSEQIALIDGDARMRLVDRVLADSAPIMTAGLLLNELERGPTDAERLRGLESAVSPGMELQVISLRRNVLTVDISGQPNQAPDRLPLAIAQIVFTATSTAGVRGVLFEYDDTPLPVPLLDGSLTSAALSAQSYPAEMAFPAIEKTIPPDS